MRLAMEARIGVRARSSYSAPVLGGMTNCGRGAAATAAGAAAGRGAVAADSTSRRTIRPPGPVPWRRRRSTPDWAAILRASGEALTRPSRPGAGAGAAVMGTTLLVAGTERYDSIAGTGAGASALFGGDGGAAAGADGAEATAPMSSAGSAITPIISPTGT